MKIVDWIDMDSAPKDGTHIIIIWKAPVDACPLYDVGESWWVDRTKLSCSSRESEWVYEGAHGYMHIRHPLSWSPLPKDTE